MEEGLGLYMNVTVNGTTNVRMNLTRNPHADNDTDTDFDGMIYYRDVFQASEFNDLDGVKYFVESRGMNVTSRNYDNETPAHCAARKCNELVLKYLMEKQPSVKYMRDIFGNTILHLVTMCGSVELVKYLIIEHNMDIYEPANVHLGNGAVHMAAHEGWVNVLRYFVEEKRVDVNLRNRMGQTLAHTAALNKKLNVVRYLLEECRADIFLVDDNNDNLLLISARVGDMSIPLYLLEEKQIKYDLNWKDRFGSTVVHMGATQGHLVILRYFVGEKNADVNARDDLGKTPLHEAAEQDHFDVVKYLVEQGADLSLKDNYGKTPQQLADNKEIIQYLEQRQSPERSRRSLRSFFLPSIRDYSSAVQTKRIAGKSTMQICQNQSFISSFLTLIASLQNVKRSSLQPVLSPSQSIRDRMDENAIEAIHAFSVFEE